MPKLLTTSEPKDKVQRRLLLNVVIRKSSPILELFASEDKALLVRRDAFLVLDLRLHVVDGVRRLHFKCDRLSGQRLDENLHTTAESKDEMEGRLLLNVVIREGTPVLELLAGEDQALLVRRDTLLVLNLRLHVVDRIGRLDFERNGLASEGLHEDLHTATQTKDEVEGGLLLDVVIRECASVLELLAGEDKALLVGRDSINRSDQIHSNDELSKPLTPPCPESSTLHCRWCQMIRPQG